MIEAGFISVFLIGLLGGVHCVSMCGGIVGALSMQVQAPADRSRSWQLHLAYNLGRILTYTAMGAALGLLGRASLLFDDILPVQLFLYVLANLMLVALGLYLLGVTALLAPIERLGGRLWRRVQPFTRRFLPVRRVRQAFPLGILWGFIPCGLVYSVYTAALLSGSAGRGAGLMLAFGLGTLPNLLLAGMAFKHFRDITRHSRVRMGAGLLVIAFGVFGLIHAPSLGGQLWAGIVC